MMDKQSTAERLASACEGLSQQDIKTYQHGEAQKDVYCCTEKSYDDEFPVGKDQSKSEPFELYKKRTTFVIRRKIFLDVVCEALSEYMYVGPNQRADLIIACRYCCISGQNSELIAY